MENLNEQLRRLAQRWSHVIWQREEVRRVLEMILDDERLRNARSTYVDNMRMWFADFACATLEGELTGTEACAANVLIRAALANYHSFLSQCASPQILQVPRDLEALWSAVEENSDLPVQWFRSRRLLRSSEEPTVTFDMLDRAISAMETLILTLERAAMGAAPSTLLCTELFDWYDVFTLPWRPRDDAEMPDFNQLIPPSTSQREVAIFPWLDLRKPITALGVTVLPRSEAIAAVGEDEAALRARTNYFYDEHRARLTPSVALHAPGDIDNSRLRIARAAHSLLLAAAAMNAPGGVDYANATLLEYFFQQLGGEAEFVARRVRRRYGSRLGGSHTALLRAQRPDWAGGELRPNAELLEALEHIADDDESDNLFDALRWYYVGSTDADPIPPDIDRIHIRTAIERLLQKPADKQSPNTSVQIHRVRALTERFCTWRCDTYEGDPRNFHQQALFVLIATRNISVHGRKKEREPYSFESMGVPLDWIFDRLFISLVICTLIANDALGETTRWRAYIEAFEMWLAGAKGSLNELWSGRELCLIGTTWDGEPREPMDIDPMLLDPAFVYVRPKS